MQCKDIPMYPILQFISNCDAPSGATMFSGYEHSVLNAMPPGTPEKVARAKMQKLIRRKLVAGCTCDCRGDFSLTFLGEKALNAWRLIQEAYQQPSFDNDLRRTLITDIYEKASRLS